MKKKLTFYSEAAYLAGIVILALGTAFMEKAAFGMSMVVAPAYLLHLQFSHIAPWFTFGMAEYCLQAFLLLLMSVILRRFRPMYLFSFCTAVLYGFVLDACMWFIGFLSGNSMLLRILCYVLGLVTCSVGVALLFHTYIAPEAYELLVKELADKLHKNISRVKTVYDCTSCAVAVIMSFAFFGFGQFEGVKLGTILCALINGWLIGRISQLLDQHFDFRDGLKLRKFFQ